jgi:energy-coupling factor transporter ATP-binding protein EcfA2
VVAEGPLLKIVGLHVEGLRALKRVDWPADGMGWGGVVPDVVVIGGVNGSGKTTLLELIFAAVCRLQKPNEPGIACDAEVRIQVRRADRDDVVPVRFRRDDPGRQKGRTVFSDAMVEPDEQFAASDLPSTIYLPSDRALVIPEEPYKAAGNLKAPQTFTYRFHAPAKWSESLEAVLYAARWADLNALAAGRTEHNFDAYAEAFSTFFEDKRLVWEDGELVVRVADGSLHALDALSSGEKQVIILVSELLRRWRPGSLVLIDEPESHMHPVWIAKLWRLLKRWQQERGGQVILATQSTQLFGLADVRGKILLGGGDLA